MADAFHEFILDEHNTLRARHGAPPLKLSEVVSKSAQTTANNCAQRGQLMHSKNPTYGENLYMMHSTQPITNKDLARNACESWYSEIKRYKFGSEATQVNCGHFTQLVWCSSKELGVGSCVSPKGACFVVCSYNPPGNVMRHFTENVRPKT